MFSRVLIAFLVLSTSPVFAVDDEESFYKRKAEGWWWGHDPVFDEELKQEDAPVAVERTKPKTAKEELAEVREKLEEALANAVLRPTEDNLREYMYLQQRSVDQAAFFSDVWRRIVWTTPELDYSLRRPVNSNAIRTYKTDRQRQIEKTVSDIAENSGLFVFYDGQDPYSLDFAQVVNFFSQKHQIPYKAISLDGVLLPEFKDSVLDKEGVRYSLGVAATPAVYLVNPYTKEVQPISFGVVSVTTLEERIHVLTATEPGEEY